MATPLAKPIVELRDASLLVADRLLFRHTSWSIRRGEQWALIGPNGSGKTLFASALTGAVPVVRGELHAAEGAVVHVSFEEQKSLAGDAPAATRWFSLEEEEALPAHQYLTQDSVEERNPFEVVARSRSAAQEFARRRQQVVKLLGIESLLEQPLPSLSNGETRKLLLARALLRQPQLLILDDPFAGLDVEFRAHLKGILEDLILRGAVHLLLIATHADELPRGITHLLRVDRCRVVAQGPYSPVIVRKALESPGRGRNAAPTKATRVRAEDEGPIVGRERPKGFAPRGSNSQAANELVRLTNVTIRYCDRVILKHIDWTIRLGESWALLGPNGSGKSTLLSLIIGDNPQAYANDVRVFGRRRGDGESIWALKSRIGWVAPELHLHFPESEKCLDAVISGFTDSYGCFHRPTARQRAVAQRWLARLGLAFVTTQAFGSLSAGLQRMVLLARALVKSPELLVLDEPCQGLDAAHRERIVRTVEGLLRHTTVIYVTHRREEIPSGIHKVLRLR